MKIITNHIKYRLLVVAVLLSLGACQKALINSVPEGTPRRSAYNAEIKKILTNDSIWVTQILDKNRRIFRVGFDFKKDGTVNLYNIRYTTLTLVQQLNLAKLQYTSPADIASINRLIAIFGSFDDERLRQLLSDPANRSFVDLVERYFPFAAKGPLGRIITTEAKNTFDVYGDFDSSLTFLNSSFLAEFKQANEFDFDFLIDTYSKDSLSMTSYYTRNVNRKATIKPVSIKTFEAHFHASNLLKTFTHPTIVKVDGNVIANETATSLGMSLQEGYDDLNKDLVFTVQPGKALNVGFLDANVLKADEVFYKVGITSAEAPASGTVLAKFKGYSSSNPSGRALTVEIIAK